MKKRLMGIFMVLGLLAMVMEPGWADQLTILHTNDTHSHLYPFGPQNQYGGIAKMSQLIGELKQMHTLAGQPVLTLNAGDVFVGTFAFNKYLGYPEMKIMEGMYDVMCLGNHEFDLGLDALTGILSGQISGDTPVQLPILCANIGNLNAGHSLHLLVKPNLIIQAGNVKAGLFGVVTTDPQHYSAEVNAVLTDPYDAAAEQAAYLQSQGCDVVICLSHLGFYPDVQGLSTVPGIDIIIGGHTHTVLPQPQLVNGKIIVQAGEFNRYLGELKIDVTPEGISLLDYNLHSVGNTLGPDPMLLGALAKLRQGIYLDPRFGPVYTRHIAKAECNLEEKWTEDSPYRDTALGNLIADAIKDSVESGGFTLGQYPLVAFEALGYIAHRIYAGKVVGNDVMRAVPYGYDPESGLGFKINLVVLLGAQIMAGLEYTVSMVEYTDDMSLQTSGLTFEYDSFKTPASSLEDILTGQGRLDPASVKVNGVPIFPDNLDMPYQIAMNEQLVNFISSLGMEPLGKLDTGLFLYSVVTDYMRKLIKLDYAPEGRIIDTAFE
jgi:5'-nucleotidase / UDP-sugar diphosphatase